MAAFLRKTIAPVQHCFFWKGGRVKPGLGFFNKAGLATKQDEFISFFLS